MSALVFTCEWRSVFNSRTTGPLRTIHKLTTWFRGTHLSTLCTGRLSALVFTCEWQSIQEQLLYRNVQRFRGGLYSQVDNLVSWYTSVNCTHLVCQTLGQTVDPRVFTDSSQVDNRVSWYNSVNSMHLVCQALGQSVDHRVFTDYSQVDNLVPRYKSVNFMHLVCQALGQSVDPRVLARCG